MENGNSNTEEPPIQIPNDILQSIVDGYNPSLKLTNFSAKFATKPGDNYLSVLYAVDLQLSDPKNGNKSETLPVMLKMIPGTDIQKKMANEMEVFMKEVEVHQKVFPDLVQFQKEVGIPKSLIFAAWPNSYAALVDGHGDYLAMENLRVSGFKTGDRSKGLDFNHCALILQQLARFHAVSFAKFGGNRQLILEAYPKLELSNDPASYEMTEAFFFQSLKSQVGTLKEAGEHKCFAMMEKLAEAKLFAILIKLLEDEKRADVMAHGDCWLNNIMFGYDDENEAIPTRMKFVDFQIVLPGSRFADISYFLYTSAQLPVLVKRERDLLMIYYSEFTRSCGIFGVDTEAKGLTWEKFLEEGEAFRFYGVCMGLMLAPLLESTSVGGVGDSVTDFYKGAMTNNAGLVKAKLLLEKYLPMCKEGKDYM